MKQRHISLLLSGFLIPGLGQISNGHRVKGIIMMSAILVLLAVFMVKLIILYNSYIHEAMQVIFSTASADPLISEFKHNLFSLVGTYIPITFLIWIASMIDAYHYGKKKEQSLS